jgi:hypothetical protein
MKICVCDLQGVCVSVYPFLLTSECWTHLYETWYVCHDTWADLNILLHESLPSVCVSVCVSTLLLGNGPVRIPISLLSNGFIKLVLQQWTRSSCMKESRWLLLPRTSCSMFFHHFMLVSDKLLSPSPFYAVLFIFYFCTFCIAWIGSCKLKGSSWAHHRLMFILFSGSLLWPSLNVVFYLYSLYVFELLHNSSS